MLFESDAVLLLNYRKVNYWDRRDLSMKSKNNLLTLEVAALLIS